MNINEYFHAGTPNTPYKVDSLENPKNMIQTSKGGNSSVPKFPSQKSNKGDTLIETLNQFSQQRFQTLGDFFSYYRSNFFKTAYTSLGMNPMGCFQLAIGNPWVRGAIEAIARPIGSSDFIAKPTVPGATLNTTYGNYLEQLMKFPNPYEPGNIFMEKVTKDRLACGTAFIEVNYNDFGFPARFDRVAPFDIDIKTDGVNVEYVKQNGYIFPEGSLIVIMNPNELDNHRGLSPLVPLFNHLMLDEAVTEHNLRFYTSDMLKGIINLDPKAFQNSYEGAVTEVERLNEQIRSMEEKGEAGHLLAYGATWQSLSSTNKDMLTPEVMASIIQAVKTCYRVPPHKIMQIESGNIGSGTGDAQEDSMNETLIDEMNRSLTFINFYLQLWTGIVDTKIDYTNLTNTNTERETDLATKNLANGTLTINEVRLARGQEPYSWDWCDVPWISKLTLPMDGLAVMAGDDDAGQVQGSNFPDTDVAKTQKDLSETVIRDRVQDYVLNSMI